MPAHRRASTHRRAPAHRRARPPARWPARIAASALGAGVVTAATLGLLTQNRSGDPAPTTATEIADRAADRAARGANRSPVSPSAAASPGATAPPSAAAAAGATPPDAASPRIRPSEATTSSPAPPAVPAGCTSYTGNRRIACTLLPTFGFGLDQMPPLDELWEHESNWNHLARNPSSGAYGIPQALPGSKMATAGADWATNPATQIRWGLDYIRSRYGTPSQAWAFWQANNWY